MAPPHLSGSSLRTDASADELKTFGRQCLFMQAYKRLHGIHPKNLCSNDQSWRTTFVGEGGIDAGGLFRESLEIFSRDLQREGVLPLLSSVFKAFPRNGALSHALFFLLKTPSCFGVVQFAPPMVVMILESIERAESQIPVLLLLRTCPCLSFLAV